MTRVHAGCQVRLADLVVVSRGVRRLAVLALTCSATVATAARRRQAAAAGRDDDDDGAMLGMYARESAEPLVEVRHLSRENRRSKPKIKKQKERRKRMHPRDGDAAAHIIDRFSKGARSTWLLLLFLSSVFCCVATRARVRV